MDSNTESRGSRAKSESRIRYEAVVELIRKKHGSLEEMRAKLGFSQKQMSELLLVDPSAWTRWVKDGEAAPAHIYQALAWYFESRENEVSLRAVPPPPKIESISWKLPNEEWLEEKEALIKELREGQQKAVGVTDGWKLFLLMNSVALLYLIVAQWMS